MPPIARRNLFHDKIRLTVTLTGISFAVVLMVVELGLFFGFSSTTSGLIDHSGADLWIAAKNIPYIEQATPFSERKLYQARAVPGVLKAERYTDHFDQWQSPDGGRESVQVVGINPDDPLGGPWNIVSGSIADLKTPDAILIDQLYMKKLGIDHLNQVVEINGNRVRIAGFTHGIRSFTTAPYLFMNFNTAQQIAGYKESETPFILIKVAPGYDIAAVQRDLKARLADVDVLTTQKFSSMTRFYWMVTTGAGLSVLIAALLGLIVGVVVVTQTIYATTIDHLPEYGTLKAMGAPNSYIYRVIFQQAAISAVLGFSLGMFVSLFVVKASESGGAAIVLNPAIAGSIFGLTCFMCLFAAVVSIQKVLTLDPAMVFKG